MACHSQFLVCFFLLTLFCRAQGLQVSMDRTPGQHLCGRLHCWQTVDVFANVEAILGMKIFEGKIVHTESQLASLYLFEDSVMLNTTKAKSMKGRGSISKLKADLTLDFYNEMYCENGTFMCELFFINKYGRIEVIHQTVEPGNPNSKCDCAVTETCPWRESSAETFQSINEVKNQLTGVKEEQIKIKEELIGQLKEEQAKMKEEQAKMKEELTGQLLQEHGTMKEELTEQFREEQTNINELTERLNEDKVKMKEELTMYLNEEQTKMDEELSRRLEEEQIKTKEELIRKLNKERFGLSEELNVLNDKLHELHKERDEMKNELTELSEELSGLKEKLKELKKETLTEKNSTVREEMDDLSYQVADIQSFLSCFPNRKVKNETPVMSSCRREMPQTCPRERFMLWGHSLALCDTETDRGGWIIIQRRTKGDTDFYRNWADYKNGFGTPDTDFWIGNDVIHNLTSQGYTELRVDLEYNGIKYFAHYSHFSVGDEVSKYKLSVSGHSGTANDSLAYQDGMKFSTFDQDNDLDRGNCAKTYMGAWWHNKCFYSSLNGVWGKNDYSGVLWRGLADMESVSSTEMKIRHV